MSWHISRALMGSYKNSRCLREREGVSLADTCPDGVPSAPSSGKPTPQAYLSPDRMTAFSRLSQFGMTCEPLTDALGADVLTWCLAASPAKTSAQPEKAPESTENEAECGHTWRGSLARFDPVSSLWKTPQCSLLEGLDEFSETWPRWGTMRNGECSEQSMPVRPISATASGSSELLPTPLASIGTNGGPNQRDSSGRPGLQMAAMTWPTPSANKQTASGELTNADGSPWDGMSKPHSAKTGKPVQTALLDAVRVWPTPCATDHKGSGKTGTLRDRLDYAAERGATKSNTYATPQARDFRSGSTDRWDNPERTRNLNDQIGGQLNPTWVEWLMGWPLGWTDLKPLETDKFQQWHHSHGEFYRKD